MTTTKSRLDRMLASAQARKDAADRAAEAAAKTAAEADAAAKKAAANEAVDSALVLFEDALREADEVAGPVATKGVADAVATFLKGGATLADDPDPALKAEIERLRGEVTGLEADLTTSQGELAAKDQEYLDTLQKLIDAEDPDNVGSLANQLTKANETNGNLQAELDKANAELDPLKPNSVRWRLEVANNQLAAANKTIEKAKKLVADMSPIDTSKTITNPLMKGVAHVRNVPLTTASVNNDLLADLKALLG